MYYFILKKSEGVPMLVSIFLSYPYIKDPFRGFKGLHMELDSSQSERVKGPDWNWAMQAKRSVAIYISSIKIYFIFVYFITDFTMLNASAIFKCNFKLGDLANPCY